MQQVKVPRVEKKKLVARQRRKEGLAGGWREKEREGESRGRTRARSSCSRLPGRGEWGGWIEVTSAMKIPPLESVIEFQPWSPPDGRSVGLDHHPRVQGTV